MDELPLEDRVRGVIFDRLPQNITQIFQDEDLPLRTESILLKTTVLNLSGLPIVSDTGL